MAEQFDFTNADDDEIGETEQQDSRPNGSQDIFERVDPWETYDASSLQQEPSRGETARGQQFTGAVTHPGPGTHDGGGNPRKMIHDVPPEWDGLDPQKNLEPPKTVARLVDYDSHYPGATWIDHHELRER